MLSVSFPLLINFGFLSFFCILYLHCFHPALVISYQLINFPVFKFPNQDSNHVVIIKSNHQSYNSIADGCWLIIVADYWHHLIMLSFCIHDFVHDYSGPPYSLPYSFILLLYIYIYLIYFLLESKLIYFFVTCFIYIYAVCQSDYNR